MLLNNFKGLSPSIIFSQGLQPPLPPFSAAPDHYGSQFISASRKCRPIKVCKHLHDNSVTGVVAGHKSSCLSLCSLNHINIHFINIFFCTQLSHNYSFTQHESNAQNVVSLETTRNIALITRLGFI